MCVKGTFGLLECISAAPEQQSPCPDSTRCNASSPKGLVVWLDVGRVVFGLRGVGTSGVGAMSGQGDKWPDTSWPNGHGAPSWARQASLGQGMSSFGDWGTIPRAPSQLFCRSEDHARRAHVNLCRSEDHQNTIAWSPSPIFADQRTIKTAFLCGFLIHELLKFAKSARSGFGAISAFAN